MKPLSAKRFLIDDAFDSMVEAIADGRLKPGERLAQERLASLLKISRQPISHALVLLKQAGLAVEKGGRGLVVAPLDAPQLRGLYQVRVALDSVAARLAAERVRSSGRGGEVAALLEALRKTVEEGRKAVAFADRSALASADAAFHMGLNRLAGNAAITDIAARHWVHLRRVLVQLQPPRELFLQAWQEHAAILDAVAAGEADRAERLTRQHAEKAAGEITQRLESARDL